MTADIISLEDIRDRRRASAADLAPTHPALRWVAGEAYYLAHRRNRVRQEAACGAEGALILAPPGVPLCEQCYPQTATEAAR